MVNAQMNLDEDILKIRIPNVLSPHAITVARTEKTCSSLNKYLLTVILRRKKHYRNPRAHDLKLPKSSPLLPSATL